MSTKTDSIHYTTAYLGPYCRGTSLPSIVPRFYFYLKIYTFYISLYPGTQQVYTRFHSLCDTLDKWFPSLICLFIYVFGTPTIVEHTYKFI